MHVLLQPLLGDLAADGKPVPDGALIAGKGAPRGLPFAALVPLPESLAAPIGLPVQAAAARPSRSHVFPLPVDGLLAFGATPGSQVPPSEQSDIADIAVAPEVAEGGDIAIDITYVEDAVEVAVVPQMPDPAVVPEPAETQEPGDAPGTPGDQPVTAARVGPGASEGPVLPDAARVEAPPGLAVAADRPGHGSPPIVPAPVPRSTPPEHAQAIGLSRRTGSGVADIRGQTRGTDGTKGNAPVAENGSPPEVPDAGIETMPDRARALDQGHIARQPQEPVAEWPRGMPSAAQATSSAPQHDEPRRPAVTGRDRAAEVAATALPPDRENAPPRAQVSPMTFAPGLADNPGKPAVETRDPGSPLAPLGEPGRAGEAAHASDPGRQRTEAAMARPVVGQVVQAIARNLPDGVVELRLQPEELGRLRLAISPTDTGYSVQVTAERPETLDLVRRNIDLLAADLKDPGFGSLDFSFGREGGAPGTAFEDLADAASDDATSDGDGLRAELTARSQTIANGRVDMRI